MGVTLSTAAEREQRRTHKSRTMAAPWWLIATTAIIALGLILVYRAKADSFAQVNSSIQARQMLNLNEVANSNDLLPYLGIFESPADRIFAATKIFEFITGNGVDVGGRRTLQNVGELRKIRVGASVVDADPGLVVFKQKLAVQRARQANFRQAEATSIPLLSLEELRLIKPLMVVRSPDDFYSLFWKNSILFLGIFLLTHTIWWSLGFNGDSLILPIIQVLCGIGLILMTSFTDPLRDRVLMADFSIGVAVGVFLMALVSFLRIKNSLLSKIWSLPLLFGLLLSALLLIAGSGPGNSDVKVNLWRFQPVEVIKILTVLFLAGYFSRHWQLMRGQKERASGLFRLLHRINSPRLVYLIPVFIAMVALFTFFYLQKDNGPILILGSLFLVLYAVTRKKFVFILLVPLFALSVVWMGYSMGRFQTVGSRVEMLLSPWDNCARGGQHLAESQWALSTGGFSGTGIGLGEPAEVPEVHTDLVLAGVGEELGFLGIAIVVGLFAILFHRCLRIAMKAPSDYLFFLALGLTLLIALSFLLIAGGTLGLIPLSGVVLPFMSWGKTSMISNLFIVGLLLSISAQRGQTDQRSAFGRPVKFLVVAMAGAAALLLGQAAYIQILNSDEIMVSGVLTVQGVGPRRYEYNPRLEKLADSISRGTILDRNGLPLATSHWDEIENHRQEYTRLGVNLDRVRSRGGGRYYPFEGITFHLLGDLLTKERWTASNTSFIERDSVVWLRGFDDKARSEKFHDPCSGQTIPVLKKDLTELIPLLRYRYEPEHEEVRRVLGRDKTIHLSIDAHLQMRLAEFLKNHLQEEGKTRGAVVVLDPETGDLLASVSYPWPAAIYGENESDDQSEEGSYFDRARSGEYPPGSTFKMVTGLAALRSNSNFANETFRCIRLQDGRVGAVLPGWGRPIRDDISDKRPHGNVNMEDGTAFSCNAYYSQLGVRIGTESLYETARMFEINVSSDNSLERLRQFLPPSAYGQGEVVATPFKMARVAATVANNGVMHYGRWATDGSNKRSAAPVTVISNDLADSYGSFMRLAVTSGTGKLLRTARGSIAGKTGTAEVGEEPSHAWFAGFAPYSNRSGRRIAFCVFIENGGYGGEVAAPVAGEAVAAALDLGIINQ